MRTKQMILMTILVIGIAGACLGELKLYEPFDYAAGTLLNGAGHASQLGFGDSSTWSYSGIGTADVLDYSSSGDFTMGLLPVSGNKARYLAAVSDNISRRTEVNTGAAAETMNSHYLMNRGEV